MSSIYIQRDRRREPDGSTTRVLRIARADVADEKRDLKRWGFGYVPRSALAATLRAAAAAGYPVPTQADVVNNPAYDAWTLGFGLRSPFDVQQMERRRALLHLPPRPDYGPYAAPAVPEAANE